MIAQAFSGNPATINYNIFVAVFGMLSLFYLIPAAWSDSFQGHALLPIVLDGLNMLFFFAGGTALAAGLGVHSCSNGVSCPIELIYVTSNIRMQDYTRSNHITNGAGNTKGRCQEAQAATAFLYFAWACFTASFVFSVLGGRGSGVNMRAPGIRKGRPAMSQV